MAQPDTRRRIPDGFTDRLRRIAQQLDAGADELDQRRPDSRDPSVAYHACIDAKRLMRAMARELRATR